VKSPLFQTH